MDLSDHCFVEGASYSPATLAKAVLPSTGDNAADSTGVVSLLRDMHMGRKAVLEPVYGAGDSTRGPAEYRFNYVGMLSVANHLFLVFPKYYARPGSGTAAERLIAAMKGVLQAIGRYNADPRHNDSATGFEYDFGDDGVADRLELFTFLLNDYADNGLYQSTAHIHEHNGDGEINWSRTIDRYVPYPAGDESVAYIDYDSERNVRSDETIIRRIHAAVVTSISRYLNVNRLNLLLDLPLAEPCDESPRDIGDPDMLLRLLRRELAVQFVTRKRLLLQALIRFVEDEGGSRKNMVLARGTCSFELVWEDICKRLFADEEELHYIVPTTWLFDSMPDWFGARRDSLTERLPGNGADAKTRSRWEHCTAGGDDEGASDMLPDVVSRTDDGRVYVLDAKYYVPSYSARRGKATVTHAPSAKDVMKQYFYYFGLAAGRAVEAGGNASLGVGIGNATDATNSMVPPIRGNAFIMPGRIAFDDPETESRRLLALRGVVYMPFMPDVMRRLYGSAIGGSVPVFEMHPEAAIRLYMDENTDYRDLAERNLNEMFD
ncbi:LlaJI family restriction endonuclease [Bifidobacterium sp. 64T4]|uniref:LlaJI family restriction endonuclease n=1 Tax=Bifidobacterium pongonis TaxID=2834432 RepID=UPI001C56C991|nr:LlaJI family restriction endonuclease [Bifidobacterium pongonis]MBW3094222.1 LlaJI family restriction endonuclease [Bifidobacterium pongonis]